VFPETSFPISGVLGNQFPALAVLGNPYSPAPIVPQTYRTERLLPEPRSYCTKIYRSASLT
jgi:hypothetical protein